MSVIVSFVIASSKLNSFEWKRGFKLVHEICRGVSSFSFPPNMPSCSRRDSVGSFLYPKHLVFVIGFGNYLCHNLCQYMSEQKA